MLNKEYYDILLGSIPADTGLTVARTVRGAAWTAAVLSDGSCGLAMHTVGETRPRLFETLAGLPLRRAAEALLSWNMEEAGEGLAAVNAWFNRAARAEDAAAVPAAHALDGVDLRGKTVGFVGHLVKPGHSLTPELLAEAKDWFILEREPREGDYPDSACEYLLPGCEIVVISGSAAINKTLPRVLELSRDAEIILTGPSVTLCPALFALPGLRRLNGGAVETARRDELLEAIVPVRRSPGAFMRHITLEKPC